MTYSFIALMFIGTTEMLLIGAVILLLFGGKKLPEMMRGLGQGIKEFKKAANDITEADNNTEKNAKKETINEENKK